MKTFTHIIVLLLICLGYEAFSQHPTELDPGYYVVVGAYANTRENVAQNYAELLNRRGFKAGYGFNSTRNYFFVYLKYFAGLREALRDMENTRKQPEFALAWVRVIPGDVTARANKDKNTEQKQETGKALVVKDVPKQEKAVVKETVKQPYPPQNTTQPESTSARTASEPDGVEVTENDPIKQFEKITLENTEVFLSLYNATNNRIVEGKVKVIDTDRTKLLKEVSGNEYLILPDPENKSGQLTLICEAFGYRKIQQEINFPLPLADTVKDYIDLLGTTFVINFDLVRYHKGDIATLYNVYFFNDAAIMMPESKYELGSLLQLLEENPRCKIRLHGHTNGNYHGRIITMGENKNFFSLDGSKSTVGSAKDLAFNRAQVIKEYLQVNGIEPSRVEIKSWGGKRPIHDRHSVNARKNVRVEVEILEE